MSKLQKILVFIFIVCIVSSLSAQREVYVTDSLHLRIYTDANANSDVVEVLKSGDTALVLEEKGAFALIETLEGNVGWAKSAFLVNEPPEKLLYQSANERNESLLHEIEELKEQIAQTGSHTDTQQVEELQQQLITLKQENISLQKKISELENSQSQAPSTAIEPNEPEQFENLNQFLTNKYLLVAAVILFLIFITGFFLGKKRAAWRSRKRLHGYEFD